MRLNEILHINFLGNTLGHIACILIPVSKNLVIMSFKHTLGFTNLKFFMTIMISEVCLFASLTYIQFSINVPKKSNKILK